MIHHIPSRAAGVLVVALTGLALSNTAAPASARTFDFNTIGTMVQQPPVAASAAVNASPLAQGAKRSGVAHAMAATPPTQTRPMSRPVARNGEVPDQSGGREKPTVIESLRG